MTTNPETVPTRPVSSLDVPAWVAYPRDLDRIVRAEIPAERRDAVFHRTDTPGQVADKLSGYAGIEQGTTTKGRKNG